MSRSSAQQQQQQAAAAPVQSIPISYPLVGQVSPHFSLQRVIDEHSGILRVKRLLFIGERCPPLAVPALRQALADLRAAQPQKSYAHSGANPSAAALSQPAALGPNPSLYAEVVQRADGLLLRPTAQPEHALFLSAGSAGQVDRDPLFVVDRAFFDSLNAQLSQAQSTLENNLAQQKRDGEREGIKAASLNLAEMYLNRGQLNEAVSKFLEAKEFVAPQSGPAQQADMLHIALSVTRASIIQLNLSHVKTQTQRAQRIVKEMQQTASAAQQGGAAAASSSAAAAAGGGEKEERELNIISCKLNAANGLYHLKNGAFHSAAQAFTSVTSDLGNHYNDVVSGSDAATYGSICALSSFSRKELKELQHNVEFKKLLESYAPATWKILIKEFYNSNYAHVFELLDTIKNDLYLDLFLQPHVNRLIRSIRERAFIQYFQAYVSVSLPVMSAAFRMDSGALQRTLAELIGEGKIAARIDSHAQVLHARSNDARNDTFVEGLALGARYSRDVRTLLLRLSLVENDVAVRSSAQEAKRKAAAAGGKDGKDGGSARGAAVAVFDDGSDASARRH